MGTSKGSGTLQQYEKHPFQLPIEDLVSHLGGIDLDHGLSPNQISELRSKYGENKLEGEGGVKWYAVLFKQISNAMILVSISSVTFSKRNLP
jgi:P-type Na+/K+ transporter